MKAISFLGATRPGQAYRPTTYVFGDQQCHTVFMADATANFFQHDISELLVLVTAEAFEQNFNDLEQAVGDLVPMRPVHIPSGQNEAELWAMFAAIESQIVPGDQIIFDITNGFRSLPVLALLATSFVRVARGATVERMIYGAYDASQDGRTPVFDLTPFVRLLDWTSATDAFLKYGRADDLVRLASGSGIKDVADTLQMLTKALQTSRPQEIMEKATLLESHMQALAENDQPAMQPFFLLRDTIGSEYHRFAHPEPTNALLADEVVAKQLDMIDWYVQKRMTAQALTAMREWMVSLVLMSVNRDLFDKKHREQAEKLIRRETTTLNAADVTRLEDIRTVWRQTTPARNTVAHGGMDTRIISAQEIEQAVTLVHQQLRGLLVEHMP